MCRLKYCVKRDSRMECLEDDNKVQTLVPHRSQVIESQSFKCRNGPGCVRHPRWLQTRQLLAAEEGQGEGLWWKGAIEERVEWANEAGGSWRSALHSAPTKAPGMHRNSFSLSCFLSLLTCQDRMQLQTLMIIQRGMSARVSVTSIHPTPCAQAGYTSPRYSTGSYSTHENTSTHCNNTASEVVHRTSVTNQ
jgi:hypothetical protein